MNLVLRTMYIDPDIDDALRVEAFDTKTSKNDLLRKYLRLGIETAKKEAMTKFNKEDSLGSLPEAEQQAYVDEINKPVMSADEVQQWIDYYMSGGELEDDIQQQILNMALLYAKSV